ncbi:high copy suppressor of a cyclic AMP-dependent protein kinase mutant [Scheffersomyces stipitis CBS 6054]|uniref:High copy suppressor of a cyclic AMP-dependent protein kinase mutant n=1 Tax=Scheffersomyces stipitis (strain ATCC 58785 / CBS 6054 / NBRC 10063 / NRRL Y-11545) TaxID=322104 RepID=A3LY00_PICST|nr:high copy suppressor of a cyclic AMP-dependent protein kinase mutant [Scheffersomyces stipitis CBS 6054]ABN67893.2 high copy suppressor of a cyclic AMP-dependent protein kinase mutant [Scheffersomyces stipitis CBS 6054]
MMNSQLNNPDNQDQIFQEDQFRQVCFDPQQPQTSGSTAGSASSASTSASTNSASTSDGSSSSSSTKRNSSSAGTATCSLADSSKRKSTPSSNGLGADMSSSASSKAAALKSKAPFIIRRFRSRSLPIINYNSQRPHHFHHHHHNNSGNSSSINTSTTSSSSSSSSSIPPLPPINLQSLKEIDLHEILKNPQLRHDILFDPQLQFRPNLDGERGKRKKSIIDKYWLEIQKECAQFFNNTNSINNNSSSSDNNSSIKIKINRLPILFGTLRDILLSLLPTKDRQQVNEIMDIDLLVQQLNHGSFDFVEMSKWLGDVFKSHCAPMRDQWVVEMNQKFVDAYNFNSVELLVGGLRMIFQILEAMKLDVANHQIRILRPVLIETAVDFERDYFQTLISHQKININDSLNWFYKKFIKKASSMEDCSEPTEDRHINDSNLKPVIISSIIDLLSCRQMATEFPSTLAFDHTRLVLLRADVRQLVCVQLCIVLYKQLVINAKKPTSLLAAANISKVQQEILAIVTDDNGNIKWTKNISSISLQLVKNLSAGSNSNANLSLPQDLVEFSYNWLSKHIQPNSEVYGLMEAKIFKELLNEIMTIINTEDTTIAPVSPATPDASNTELKNIAMRISTLVKFHWNVFGNYYIDHIKSQHHKLQQDKKKFNVTKKLMNYNDNDSNSNNSNNNNSNNDSNNDNAMHPSSSSTSNKNNDDSSNTTTNAAILTT